MKRKNNTPVVIRVMRWWFPKLEKWAPFLAERFFRLVFYVPAPYPVPAKEKEAASHGEDISLDIPGKRLRGYAWGKPELPYILLVHGWAGRATQFRKFIKPLNEAGYRVLGFDGPAHGRSDGIKTSILEFEQMLKDTFSKYGQPEAVITHSFGGGAALYAASHGLPIKKLINIASPSIADEILKTFLRAIHGSWRSAEMFKEFVIRRTGKTFEEFTALHAVKNLSNPLELLLVHDDDDPDVLLVHAIELQKVFPSARLYTTRGLGHTRILKDEGVIAACIDFIRNKEGS